MLQEVEPFVPLGKRLKTFAAYLVLTALYLGFTAFALWASAMYGYVLFLGVPFAWSFVLCAWHSWRYGAIDERALGEILQLQVWMLAAVAFAMLILQAEGLICIVMAAPLVFLSAFAAWLLLNLAHRLFRIRRVPPAAAGLGVIALILFSGMESRYITPPPPFEVVSEVLINAPPEVVWNNVIAFPELPAPSEWIFKAGIAYPMRARIDGHGPGAIRRCEFNTGAFVEPIEIWDEPRRLQFTVTENPAPMTELNPFGHTEPPHLHGFLNAERGKFELIPTSDGKTLLRGTTWYRHNLYPAAYWRLWSDAIIHRIHLRVLTHIKTISERT